MSLPWWMSDPAQANETIGGHDFSSQQGLYDVGYLFPGGGGTLDYSSKASNAIEDPHQELSSPNYHFEIGNRLAAVARHGQNAMESTHNPGAIRQEQPFSYQKRHSLDVGSGGDVMDTSNSCEQWQCIGDGSSTLQSNPNVFSKE